VGLETFLLHFLLRWSFSLTPTAMLVNVNGLMLTDC
jgi:hypothetical protein